MVSSTELPKTLNVNRSSRGTPHKGSCTAFSDNSGKTGRMIDMTMSTLASAPPKACSMKRMYTKKNITTKEITVRKIYGKPKVIISYNIRGEAAPSMIGHTLLETRRVLISE